MVLFQSSSITSIIFGHILYITYIYPMQIIIALIPNGQNKYLWVPKNICLNFISVQYFQRATWTFSWTFLEQFLSGSFPEMISKVFTNPQFNFKWNLNKMHTWLASIDHTRTRDVTACLRHLSLVTNPLIEIFDGWPQRRETLALKGSLMQPHNKHGS